MLCLGRVKMLAAIAQYMDRPFMQLKPSYFELQALTFNIVPK